MEGFFEHLADEFHLPLHNPVLIFSLILFIILLSPILLKRLNIPGIIGLIISGVIIGPHGLNILEKSSAVELFSTIGLLYIMFIAGLELDMNDFKANKNKSLLFGLFTFIIPIVIGFPICYYLLGYGFSPSLLTASMFATHTLVAYPIVSRLGISKNQAVSIAVGGTILTDTAVLIILAVVLKSSQGNLNGDFWTKLIISLAIFSTIMFVIIPRIAKWFFSKLESEKHAHYIFVLSVVFFAAFLAEVAGVEPIIGAFVAGLALNKLIPHSSALMNRIEFIGNSLFIPFFLISVGMIVDVSVIMSGTSALVVAGTLTLVALGSKWLAALATQYSFGYTANQRQLIFGLSSAHAAATLAVILVGYKANILDENILNGTIILILITCVVASLVTEKASKRMIILGDEEVEQSHSSNNQEHILVPISDVENMEKQLDFALLIKDKKSPNPISVLSVVQDDEAVEANIKKSRNYLSKYITQGSAAETKINTITAIDHNAMSGISRTSREILADIILLGWPQKSGFIEKIMGEKLGSVLQNSDKTTFIANLDKPIVSTKRLVIVLPPLSELEIGFTLWINKIFMLAKELSVPTLIICEPKSKQVLSQKFNPKKSNYKIEEFSDWEDALIISKLIHNDDFIILCMPRKGTLSYHPIIGQLPQKLEKYFFHNNKLLVYPKQHFEYAIDENYEDLSNGPIPKSIESIRKSIFSIFKRDK